MHILDLKSDTVTLPTEEMLRFVKDAKMGDDAYGEDPVTNELEGYCASLFGKEAALFTSSGTMSNQLAIHAQTTPGEEVILDRYHHINYFEGIQAVRFAGVILNPVKTKKGILTYEEVNNAIEDKPRSSVYSRPSLVCIENTVSYYGGFIFPYESIKSLYIQSKERGLNVHIDGARIANACVKTGISFKEYAQYGDTVSMCFSKGLGAPFGSILVGTKQVIDKARKYRKWHGGQLHQSGHMAAAALYAIKNNVSRITDDHANASLLASLLVKNPVLKINKNEVYTNIVMINIEDCRTTSEEFIFETKQQGLELFPWDKKRVRAIIHVGISKKDIYLAAEILQKVTTSC